MMRASSDQLRKTRPLVSILINNFNYGRYLKQSIDSTLAQTYPNIEVIVVDDGSQDNSIEVLSTYSAESINTILKKNGGQASAFNVGFSASSGEIICFLDSDDYFYPHKVEEICSLFQKDPDIGFIFHQLDYIDNKNSLLTIKNTRHKSLPNRRVDFREILEKGKRFTETIPCGLCFRRGCLNEIFPIPESTGVTISDNYIKYSALSLSSGMVLSHALAVQRIHDANTYTFRQDNKQLQAEINVKTGFYLRENFSHIHRLANKVFSRGCGQMIAEGNYRYLLSMPEFQSYHSNISFPMRVKTFTKSLMHAIRFKWKKLSQG